jgi:hypothetical protein
MRIEDGHSYLEDDGSIGPPGDMMEVAAPHRKQLLDRGYELISVRRIMARDR